MIKSLFACLGAVLASSAVIAQPSYDPQAQLERALAGRVAGPRQSCINLRQVTRTQIISGTGILYRVGNRVYLNRPRVGLEWLDRDNILVTRPVVSQLCRNEPVQLIDRTGYIQRGFVTLGDFVPYTRTRSK